MTRLDKIAKQFENGVLEGVYDLTPVTHGDDLYRYKCNETQYAFLHYAIGRLCSMLDSEES